jgi:hypothetical protein
MTNSHVTLQEATNAALELRAEITPAAQAGSDAARWMLKRVNCIIRAHDSIRAEWEAQARAAKESERRIP